MIVMKKYLSQIILLMMFIPVFAQEKSSSSSGDVKVLNASNFTAETAKGCCFGRFLGNVVSSMSADVSDCR
mgnify:CR=1 FL=1